MIGDGSKGRRGNGLPEIREMHGHGQWSALHYPARIKAREC
jgi:hypothetical protein